MEKLEKGHARNSETNPSEKTELSPARQKWGAHISKIYQKYIDRYISDDFDSSLVGDNETPRRYSCKTGDFFWYFIKVLCEVSDIFDK